MSIGQRFGRLVVVEQAPKKRNKIAWVCKCDCEELITVLQESLRGGNTKSCGCFRKETAAAQGITQVKDVCKHGYDRVPGNSKDCDCPVRIKQKKSANLKHSYGVGLDEFNAIVEEQNRRCLGCQRIFTLDLNGIFADAALDHDHETKRVRGVLCRLCNAALGCVRENPETLRRLIAYMGVDRKKPLIYLIGRLKNHKIVEVANFIRDAGYDVFEDWNYAGPDCDDWWQKREKQRGRTYLAALKGRSAQNAFLFDKAYLDLARAVVLVAPGGKSAYMELGYSKGSGKPTFVLLPKGSLKRYELMMKFADDVVEDKEGVLVALNQRFGAQKQ